MHILRLANFVSPTSGGIRTALAHWGQGYREHGHRVSLVIPGPGPVHEEQPQGTVHRVPALPVGSTGYSLILHRRRLARLLEQLAPDVIEVSDRTTLRWTGAWAARHGVGSVMISHENLSGILQRRTPLRPGPAARLADVANRRSAAGYDAVVCPSRYAAQEFDRLGSPAQVVPLGVDLDMFRPSRDGGGLTPDGRPRTPGRLELVHCGRLSPEKNPGLSVETLRELGRRGVDAHLTVLGHGPMHDTLARRARGLPVTFHPYIPERADLAAVMARADAATAPGPVETFGLAALEAMACGVPTVCPDEGALQEVVGDAGVAAPSRPEAFADAVQRLVAEPGARAAARARAEGFSWGRSTERMLEVHRGVAAAAGRPR